MKEEEQVKEYFERAAKDFDDIYDNRGGFIVKIANKYFRKGMRERFNLTLGYCGFGNKKIIDVGCGAGRFAIPLAERGMQVTGIDYSKKMIRMAKEYLKYYEKKIGKKLNVKYLCCDFLNDFSVNGKYDISLALGVFDYVKYPVPLLKKMRDVTSDFMIVSFPNKFTPQTPIRKIWLMSKHCPVYFYTEKNVRELYSSVGINDFEIVKVPAGYVVKSNTKYSERHKFLPNRASGF